MDNPVYVTDHGTPLVAISMHFIYFLNIEPPLSPFSRISSAVLHLHRTNCKITYKIISNRENIFWNSKTLQNTQTWFTASLHSSLSTYSLKNRARKNVRRVCLQGSSKLRRVHWNHHTLKSMGWYKGEKESQSLCTAEHIWHQRNWKKHIVLVSLSSPPPPSVFLHKTLKFFLHFTSKTFSPKALRIWIRKRMYNFLTTVKLNWFLD